MQTKFLAALAFAVGLSVIIAFGPAMSSRLVPPPPSNLDTRPARAQGMVELSGRITGPNGAPAVGASIQIQDPISKQAAGSATTSDDGRYSAQVPTGTYSLDITPADTTLQSLLAPGRVLINDSTLDITLAPVGVTTLSGRVVNPVGVGIPSQRVLLGPLSSTEGGTAETDLGGEFAIPVSPGSYRIRIQASGYTPMIGMSGNPVDQVPETYDLVFATALNMAKSFMVDLVLPTKRLTVNVQDEQGQPVANALVQVSLSKQSLSSMGTTAGVVPVAEVAVAVSAVTDASGNAGLWVFPNDPSGPYAMTVDPPDGSPLAPGGNPELTITDDQTETIVLTSS